MPTHVMKFEKEISQVARGSEKQPRAYPDFPFEGGRLKYYESRRDVIYSSAKKQRDTNPLGTGLLGLSDPKLFEMAEQIAREEAQKWHPRGPRKTQHAQLSLLQKQILEWLVHEELTAQETMNKTDLARIRRRGVAWTPKRFMQAYDLDVSSATISESLKRLEARGLVSLYKVGQTCKKTQNVRLMDAGREALEELERFGLP